MPRQKLALPNHQQHIFKPLRQVNTHLNGLSPSGIYATLRNHQTSIPRPESSSLRLPAALASTVLHRCSLSFHLAQESACNLLVEDALNSLGYRERSTILSVAQAYRTIR